MKQTIIVIAMLLFICSCNKNVEEPTDKSKIMAKQDEIIMSMRIIYLEEMESAFELSSWTLKKFDRMKKDYYYKLSNQETGVFTIPGPGWKIKGPLDPNSLNINIEKFGDYQIDDEEQSKGRSYYLMKFYNNYKEGGDLYSYRSDDASWASLRGREGIILVRGNKVIDDILTGMN